MLEKKERDSKRSAGAIFVRLLRSSRSEAGVSTNVIICTVGRPGDSCRYAAASRAENANAPVMPNVRTLIVALVRL